MGPQPALRATRRSRAAAGLLPAAFPWGAHLSAALSPATLLVATLLSATLPAAAQPPGGGLRLGEKGDWQLEEVEQADGRVRRGLIVREGPLALEFAEIRRPAGRPMYVVILPLERAAVGTIRRLPDEARRELSRRIERFRRRALVEAGSMERVELTRQTDQDAGPDERPLLRYDGGWFTLDSSADEESTRRCIVRLEQMFLAFRQVVPPRRTPSADRPLRVRVFGTVDRYYHFLGQQGFDIRNPAYFAGDANLIVAGSDVRRVVEELARLEQRHAEVREEQALRNRRLSAKLAELKAEYGENPPKEWDRIVTAAHQRARQQLKTLEREIAQADRQNRATKGAVVAGMLRRVYHEGFHAYLENYVYPADRHDVPLWLNEGLAQIFEAGILEGDALRIDAPRPQALARLQRELRADRGLPLAELLSADQRAFLVPHRTSGESSSRHYLYSWGVAYYLAFLAEPSPLGTAALDDYVDRAATPLPPRERFERLVAVPLEAFEAKWREAMLALPVPRP